MGALRGKYRVMQPAFDRGRGYYGIEFGALDERGEVAAVLLANRLFRMPIALRDPGGLATDVLTNAAMMLGFSTAALEDAEAAARMAYEDARRLGVPLLIGGQSQAGGTAQLQIATLQKAGASDASAGFVTLNAADALRSIRRLGLAGEEVEGINFAKTSIPASVPRRRSATAWASRSTFTVTAAVDASRAIRASWTRCFTLANISSTASTRST
jgi:hypothetical protein